MRVGRRTDYYRNHGRSLSRWRVRLSRHEKVLRVQTPPKISIDLLWSHSRMFLRLLGSLGWKLYEELLEEREKITEPVSLGELRRKIRQDNGIDLPRPRPLLDVPTRLRP